jgi:single-strand DNA-binding protein
MSTTITGKLNKQATQFQAGESTGFGVRLGVKFYDRESKTEQWCNYEAVVFAKAPAQIQFYQSALIEGAIVEVSGDKQRIKQFQGANGLSLSIEILDARLGAVFAPQGQAPQQRQPQQPAQAQQQGFYNPPQGQSPRPAPAQYNQQPAPQYGQQQFDPNLPDF